MVNKLHHMVRSGFSLLVALAIALPGVGFSATANQAWATAQQRAVNDPAPTTLEEAKANLDLANTLESEAAEEEAKAKAALDAAKVAHNTASSNQQAALSMVDQATNAATAKIEEIKANAQAEYDAAYARVEEAAKENQAAQAAKNEAQANLSQAKADYDAAQQAYDSLANTGNADLQQASEKLRQAEEAYDSAVTQYKEAFNTYNVASAERDDAVAALNAAKKKVTTCEAAVAEAQKKVDAAQKALDDARGELSAASEDSQKEALEAAVSAAQGKLDAAKGEKAAAQSRLTNAKSEQSAAQQTANDAQAALDEAKKNTGGVDIDALENAVKAAQDEYDAAKKTYDEGAQNAGATKSFQQALADKTAAETAFEEAKNRANEALQKYDTAKKELAAISAGDGGNQQTVLSVIDYFAEQGSTDASNLFTSSGEAFFTNSGTAGDATDQELVNRALDVIETINTLRTSHGLQELQVSDYPMAQAILSLNMLASDNADSMNLNEQVSHSSNANYAIMGLDQDWWSSGKNVWDNALATGAFTDRSGVEQTLPSGWQDMTIEQLAANTGDFYYSVRGYKLLSDPSYIYVGAAANALAQNASAYEPYWFTAIFSSTTNGPSKSFTQWKADFNLWVQTKQSSTASIAAAAGITASATDEEIAAAQAKVDACEKEYNDAVADRDAKEQALEAAQTQYSAAESVKGLEDALAAANVKLGTAQQAYDNAQNSVGDLDDPNHPLNVALANAQATLQTKNEAVASIQNEITALDTEIIQFTTELSTAQDALDAYNAKDTTAEEVALAAAQRELESAQRDLEAALAEVEQLTHQVTDLGSKCIRLNDKLINVRENVMKPARQASDVAKREFYDIAKQTQAESDYRALYGAKHQLDEKRDDYNKIVWGMPELESNAEAAQRSETTARDKLIAADAKREAAQLLTLEGVMANPINEYNYAEFLVLNDHAQNVKDAQALVPVAANKESAAKADLDAAQAAYDAAHAKHLTSLDDAAEAKRIYESFLGHKDDTTTKPDEPNHGSDDSEDDPNVEVWEPNKPNGATAGNKNGNKGQASPLKADARGDQGNGAEAQSIDEAQAEETMPVNASNGLTVTSKPSASPMGINPFMIVGLVGLLLIAAGIAVFLLARRRREVEAAAAGASGAAVSATSAAPVVAENATAAVDEAAAGTASSDPSSAGKSS